MSRDTPVNRVDVSQLSDDELDNIITEKRERRLQLVRHYEALMAVKAAAEQEKLSATIEKQMEMFQKELERVDKAIDKLEQRATKLRALRLQLS